MLRWQTLTGIALGLVAGLMILFLADAGRKAPPQAGAILSESDGHLRELVIYYEPSARETVATPYREFLGALEADVTVYVVSPSQGAFEELRALAGKVACQLRPIIVNHPMTTWSRDRWVALLPGPAGGPTTLLSPRGEASEELWPARAGDERTGADIARALEPSVFARHSSLFFDGGDFLADCDNVFVVPRVLHRNIQRTVQTQEEFLRILSAEFKRRVVLLDEAPEHHAGMFMVSVGNQTMLVGDPSLGRRLLPATVDSAAERLGLPGGPDFTPQTQHLFDAVAAPCTNVGYRVIRVPIVPATDGRTYLSYVNVLLDQQGDRRIVYLPIYRGADGLNTAARSIWESIGYQIRPVDCTSVYRQFGCLHCLVNVMKRW